MPCLGTLAYRSCIAEERAAVHTCGLAVWQVVGAPLAAALLLMEGVCGLHGWQWLFIIEGAATCLWGIVLAVSSFSVFKTL